MKTFLLILFCIFISSANAATKHDIEIKKFKFSPKEITIEVGDLIRWTNKEKRQYHSVWFEQLGEPEPDYFFPDEFFERTFNEAGDFPYRCGPHPKMKGIVHVIPIQTKTTSKKKNKENSDNKNIYEVESVEDGDTLVINYKGKSQRVQLIGIDAPENTQNPKLNLDSKTKEMSKKELLEMGALASQHLSTLVKQGDKVTLRGNFKQKDKYIRLPAIIINDKGESLNKRMVEDGYALLLTRFPLEDAFKAELKEAEQQAIKTEKGLWKSHSSIIKKWSGHTN